MGCLKGGGSERMQPSLSSFADFQQVVIADAVLFGRLQALDEPEAFSVLAVQLGRERGFTFTPDDVLAGLQAARRAWIERNLA